MSKNRFHEKWILPLLAVFICTFAANAQCPTTKSVRFGMVPLGLPSLERVQPTDFLIDINDTAYYYNLSLDRNHFLCVDVGIQEVTLFGNDRAGKDFACDQLVWVFDSVRLCSDEIRTPMAVAGKVVTEKKESLSNVAMGLSSGVVNYFKGTNEQGAFMFEDFEPQDYELVPSNPFDENIRNGISTFDVLLLQKHILGLRPLDSPYKIIAADLNNSGDVTAFDMLLLRQLILSVINEFPDTPSWKFVDANYAFANAKNPLAEDFRQTIKLDMKNADPALDNRFIAIKMGDMNNSVDVSPSAINRASVSDSKPVFTVTNQVFKKGELVEVPFRAASTLSLEGLQFALRYDEAQLEFLDFSGELPISETDFSVSQAHVAVSWTTPNSKLIVEDKQVITLTFRAKKDDHIANAVQLDATQLMPEIYLADEQVLPFRLSWNAAKATEAFQVFANYPNPFHTTTYLPFMLPKSSAVTVRIFDAKGQFLFSKQATFSAGKHQLEIGENLTDSGIYFYQFQSDFGIQTGRLNFYK